MGEHDILSSLDDERRRRFSRAVLDDLRALDAMCSAGLIERGVRRIGAEQEMFLVDRSGRPAPIALDLLPQLGEGYTTEIGRFNLEYNLPPSLLGAGALRAMETTL